MYICYADSTGSEKASQLGTLELCRQSRDKLSASATHMQSLYSSEVLRVLLTGSESLLIF